MLLDADALRYRQRRLPAPAGRTGVALLLGGIGIFGVALGRKIGLPRLHLRLLYRKDVGIQCGKAGRKVVGQAGTQAVYIPADEFHFPIPF